MPTNFDWGNVNGTNYLTVTKNQHVIEELIVYYN